MNGAALQVLDHLDELRVGSLFSGYGGLELGILQVFQGARVVFHVEHDVAPSRILKHHWPNVPNLGDITRVNWRKAPHVHVLCGGFPCQDVSPAGLRKGLHPDTRSGLWSHFALAIAELRPSLVIVENVRGLLSAEAHSDLEPDAWAVGDGDDGPALRALGAVLGDLADLGYDAEWCCVPASAAGAPHRRERVFIVAYPQRDERARERREGRRQPPSAGGGKEPVADPKHVFLDWARRARDGWTELADGGSALADPSDDGRASRAEQHRPTSQEPVRAHRHDADRRAAPDADGGRRRQGVGELHPGQSDVARGAAADAADDDRGRGAGTRAEARRAWGEYGSAIARWEAALGRVAPAPTEDGRLSPVFVEWMMGLPAGHVTDVGLRRSQQLKALGNGVVPQQAALAIRALLGRAA